MRRAASGRACHLARAGISILTLLATSAHAGEFDTTTQIGPHPVLPAPHQYLFPPMHLAVVTPWKTGETPTVPVGLRVQALVMGLQHPRSVYTLPNGDVLVVESRGPGSEPVARPKNIIMAWIKTFATSGGPETGSNRITLLRDTHHAGKPDVRTVFLDHLHSPFGVALIGNDLYVADTDAIRHYSYVTGETSIADPGTIFMSLPGGPIDHHWTKSLVASEDGTKLYVGVGSNSNITENGMAAELDRAAIWEVDRTTGAHRIFASGLRNPNGLSWEPQVMHSGRS